MIWVIWAVETTSTQLCVTTERHLSCSRKSRSPDREVSAGEQTLKNCRRTHLRRPSKRSGQFLRHFRNTAFRHNGKISRLLIQLISAIEDRRLRKEGFQQDFAQSVETRAISFKLCTPLVIPAQISRWMVSFLPKVTLNRRIQ